METDGERLLVAVRDLLAAKGIASPQEIAERIALTDAANPAQGARMVAKAWTDPEFRALMLEDGTRAAESLGIPMRGAPPLGVLENTPELHHLVVCTLCSCYPRAVLGYPPFWFKSAAYRARAVRDPRGVLAEWGTHLPESVAIRVRRFDRGLSLDGAADATSGHRGVARGEARGDFARGGYDWGDGAGGLRHQRTLVRCATTRGHSCSAERNRKGSVSARYRPKSALAPSYPSAIS